MGRLPEPAVSRSLFTPHRLLELLQRRCVEYPQLRCLTDGTDAHPREYLTQYTTGRGQSITMPDMDRIGRFLRDGCTLVLDDLAPLDARMDVACRALSWWTGEIARVNIYLSTQNSTGWGLHWDSHDVICVQLSGEKSWEVRGSSRSAPMERDIEFDNDVPDEIVWSGVMRAGDVMHIPRGWWHQADREDHGVGHSLYATFGITQRTGVDWLSWVADHSRSVEEFRRDLSEPPSEALVEQAHMLVNKYSSDAFMATRAQQISPSRRVATFGVFGPPESVVCVARLRPEIDVCETDITILGGGKRIRVPARFAPVVSALLSGNPVRVADLRGCVEEHDLNRLVETLIESGLCAEVTPELADAYPLLPTVRR